MTVMATEPSASLQRPPMLVLDIFISLIAASATIFVGERLVTQQLDSFLEKNGVPLYTTLAQIAAALLGFVITGVSIALVIVQDEKFSAFRETVHYQTLWRVFKSSTWSLGIATVIAIAAIFAADDRSLLYLITPVYVFAALRLLHAVRTVFAMTLALAEITRSIDIENRRLKADGDWHRDGG